MQQPEWRLRVRVCVCGEGGEGGGGGGALFIMHVHVFRCVCRKTANDQSHEPLSLKALSAIGTLISSFARKTVALAHTKFHPPALSQATSLSQCIYLFIYLFKAFSPVNRTGSPHKFKRKKGNNDQ